MREEWEKKREDLATNPVDQDIHGKPKFEDLKWITKVSNWLLIFHETLWERNSASKHGEFRDCVIMINKEYSY